MNADLDATVTGLRGILAHTLAVDDYIPFDWLKDSSVVPPFEPGLLGVPEPPPAKAIPTYQEPPALGWLARLLPGRKAKHEAVIALARAAHADALAKAEEGLEAAQVSYAEREQERERKVALAQFEHDKRVVAHAVQLETQHAAVDEFERQFNEEELEAICRYFSLVLENSTYPPGMPEGFQLAYVPESKQLVVERQLPEFSSVPADRSYRLVQSRNEVVSSARPMTERRSLYASTLAQMSLRTLHELFEADRSKKIETIVLNAYVDTIDAGTGKPIKPYLLTVRTTREAFLDLDLANVEPLACLKKLNAGVSKSPSELAPVRPLLEFNMVDPRFVQASDVLDTLDQRPNLMELTPSEFEALITNLFEKMGLDTKLTQASRDGGVDCVAYDPRPILGGKVVIQAKRYKNTVGVSAVRDLFGTMQNEGASKGILVTTSGYGKASFDFADGKPLELLSGSNLLYLLAEHAGIEAKIEVPDDWIDPLTDAPEEVALAPPIIEPHEDPSPVGHDGATN